MRISFILEDPPFDPKMIEEMIEGILEGNVEIVIADPGYIRVLNRRYRHINRSTDVLSFDLADSEDDRPEGVVYVDGRLYPPVEALLERIFHGYLHLIGYSHEDGNKAGIMNDKTASLVLRSMNRAMK